MSDKTSLSTTSADVVAAAARGVSGAIPWAGGAVGEILSSFIPNQKLERVARFAELLAAQVDAVEAKQALFEARIKTAEGSDLLEEGIVQASRAVSRDRQQRIAAILAAGLTADELRYDRTRKLLTILESLTDSEILLLLFYSRTPTIGSPWHKELMNQHPELLRPASRENGAPASERERGAIRDSYERTLLANGLLDSTETRLRISDLGQMLLTYSETPVDAEPSPLAP
jgi:hypothetical protein